MAFAFFQYISELGLGCINFEFLISYHTAAAVAFGLTMLQENMFDLIFF